MKIVIVADRLELGGVESHIISLVNGFLQRGHQILLSAAASSTDLLAQINITNNNFLYVSWSENPVDDVKGFEPDVVHAHPFTAIIRGYQIAITLNKPFFITIHGLYDFGIDRSALGYSVGEKVKTVIAVDLAVAELLQKNISYPEKITIIHNGIDLNVFQPLPLNLFERANLGLNQNWFTIVVVSRLGDGKETPILQLVKDAPKLGFYLRGLNVVIVGDGPGFERLQEEIRFIHSPGFHYQVIAVGRQLEVIRYLAIADIVMACDRAALEAMACQKPVLAMNASGFAGMISKNNYQEILLNRKGYHPISEAELIKTITICAKKKKYRTKLGLNGCSIVHRYFDLNKIIDQLEQLFRESISKLQ